MRKIIELLKVYLLNQLRQPLMVLWTLVLTFGILGFGLIINPGEMSSIAASYAMFLVAYTSAIILAYRISEDRKNGIYRMMRTTRLSKLEYIGSSFLISNSASFLLAGIILGIAALKTELIIQPLALAVIVLLTALSHAGIGLIIAGLVKTERQTQLVTAGLMMVMVVLSPVFYTLERIPDFLSFLPKIVPITYSIEAIRAVTVDGASLYAVKTPLLLLVLLSLITISVGYRRLEF